MIRLVCSFLLYASSGPVGDEAQRPAEGLSIAPAAPAATVKAPETTPRAVGWREDFQLMSGKVPRGWRMEGTKLFINDTSFQVADNPDEGPGGKLLVIEAREATGTIVTMPLADLARYPVLRWKWRVRQLAPGADGRNKDLDDQAVAVYFGAGGVLNRKSVGYRWETETPIGTVGKTSYGAGVISVKYTCLRNKTSPLDTWIVEEVDAAAAFREAYGYLPGPDEYVVSVNANSQYTGSHSIAEIAFIELVAPPPEKSGPEQTEKTGSSSSGKQ